MPKKEKILILSNKLGEYFCPQAEKIGLEPIHFYSKEWGDIPEFKVNIWTKYENIFRRIFFKDKTFLHRKYDEYHQKMDIKRLKNIIKKHPKIDYILFFCVDIYSKKAIQLCRKISKQMISYQFDGTALRPKILDYQPFFDKIFTFDKNDQLKYHFLPLTNCWFPNPHINTQADTDIFYVGTGTPDRIKCATKISEYANKKHLKLNLILGIPNHVSIQNKGGIKFIHDGISFEENWQNLMQSKAVLDLKLPHHDGLSFRFFEAIYYKKKIITDNVNVKNYDFYHPDNIFITDYENFSGLKEFLDKPYYEIDEKIVNKYGVENWLKYVLDIEPHQKIDLPELWKD